MEMVSINIIDNFLEKKLKSKSKINTEEFFNSKIHGQLTQLQQELQLDQNKKIAELRASWAKKLQEIYKEKGLKMKIRRFEDIPVFTLENVAGMRREVIKDNMKIILVQGNPSSGKSTVAIPLLSLALDQTFTVKRIAFSREDVQEILNYIQRNVTKFRGKGLVWVFDEGTDALFAGDSGSKIIKDIIRTFSKIREANPMIIINSTSIKKINPTIRDEFIDAIIRTPKKGIVEFYNKAKMSRLKFPKDGGVIWPKPNFKERTPKIDGAFWEEYRKVKHKFLSDGAGKGINSYKDAIDVIGMIPNDIDKLILLFHFEGFGFKEMTTLKKKDYKQLDGYLNGRRLKPETREVLNEYLTMTKDKRKKLIFPKMKIRDLQDQFMRVKNEFK